MTRALPCSTSFGEDKMKRRSFFEISLQGLAFGAAGICAGGLSCSGEKKKRVASGRPNIVLIVSDDTGWHDVGWHGSEIKTPTLDRMARGGVELDSFYAYPTCSPTRASLLTGRPPSRFGILGPIAMRSTLSLPKDTPTLAEHLRRSGYETAISGKWHLGLRPEVGPNEYGFTSSYGYLHGQIDQYTHYYKNGDRSWHRNGEFIDEEGHATDLITDEAIAFIGGRRDTNRPFFLYVPFSVPHYPLQEDERWTAQYDGVIENESRRLFAASMTHMDDAVGRILAALEDGGIADNTIVVFLSDNGGQESWTPTFEYDGRFTPNDVLGDNTPLRGWKGDLYEGGIRLPAVVFCPAQFSPRRVDAPVIAWDIFPTLAEMAGVPVTDDMPVEGASVLSLLSGGTGPGDRVLYWRTGAQLAVQERPVETCPPRR